MMLAGCGVSRQAAPWRGVTDAPVLRSVASVDDGVLGVLSLPSFLVLLSALHHLVSTTLYGPEMEVQARMVAHCESSSGWVMFL